MKEDGKFNWRRMITLALVSESFEEVCHRKSVNSFDCYRDVHLKILVEPIWMLQILKKDMEKATSSIRPSEPPIKKMNRATLKKKITKIDKLVKLYKVYYVKHVRYH